jgi:hypothetical protein
MHTTRLAGEYSPGECACTLQSSAPAGNKFQVLVHVEAEDGTARPNRAQRAWPPNPHPHAPSPQQKAMVRSVVVAMMHMRVCGAMSCSYQDISGLPKGRARLPPASTSRPPPLIVHIHDDDADIIRGNCKGCCVKVGNLDPFKAVRPLPHVERIKTAWPWHAGNRPHRGR